MLRPHAVVLLVASVSLLACEPVTPQPDGGNPSGCPAASGSGTTHAAAPTASETWAASGNPHLVTADLKIAKGLTVTLEPCAEVRLSANTRLTVEGNLVGRGTATSPIRIAAADASKPFAALVVWAPGTLELAYTTVASGGADTVNSWGAIEARGDQLLPAQPILKLNQVAVTGAVAYGVSLRAGGAFTADSSALTVTGAGKAPIRALPRLLSNIPTGSYTGNGVDAIVVETEAYGDATLEDVTVRERGVPYQVGAEQTFGTFNVGGGTAAVKLTIEPGVVMKFKKHAAAGLVIDKGSATRAANGTLVAVGTAAKPIVFTSAAAAPAAGDWLGLVFGNTPAAANQLDRVEIRYAGAPSAANSFHCQPGGAFSANEDAAISLYGQPASAFLTNSTIADSAGAGVNLAYTGTPVDFLPTNTFSGLAGCKVTYPRPTVGACPTGTACQ